MGDYSFFYNQNHNIYNSMKPAWSELPILPKKIASIDFSILSSQDTIHNSESEVNSAQLYDENFNPIPNGPLDRRMGVGNQEATCATCHHKLQNCVGHFGHTHLNFPIYHIGYFKHLVTILKMVCKQCSRVLLTEQEILDYGHKMRRVETKYTDRQALFKKISKEASKNKTCPHCNFINPVIQKIPKIAAKVQSRHPNIKNEIFDERVKRRQHSDYNKEKLEKNYTKGDFHYQMNPWEAFQIISRIPKKQWILVNVAGSTDIRSFIVQELPVPPVCIRPSLKLSTSDLSNEDDLTMNLKYLLKVNKEIKDTMLNRGEEISKVYKKWYLLQSYWSQYINGDTPGLPINQLKYKQIKSLCNRIKGKQGRFRQNLSGKRSNFTGRTVISPDPNLRPDQVIVPEYMSKIVTVSETVTAHSILLLQQCVERGQKVGGANFVINKAGERMMAGSNKFKIKLNIGDVVERHLRDGDIVIFNRQPSLHRISMMGFKVKISPGKSLRFNQCVCAPFNADFDGDEMNIHVPQTYEARAETWHLMGVNQNIITPKSGEPIIALIQDFLTTSYLITDKDNFYDRTQFCEILSWFADASEMINLPPPAIILPYPLWTGKQVISALLRPNRNTRTIINFKCKEKSYTKGEVMCLKDGWVIVRNGELISGQLGKATLGGNKNGLIYALLRDNNNPIACEVMHRISKLSSRWLSNYGMTIGISDVTPSDELESMNQRVKTESYAAYDNYMKDYERGTLESKPGMTIKQTLESLLNTTLSKVRETVGDNCISHLDRFNKPLIMALCGSKGSPVNLSQMIGCVGQQTVGGKRITYGFTERTLPHFQRLNESPDARGFVSNSFYTGLTPTEFFFHTMGGREGIIDTAVKTADTGYMQRRLIKLLEDIGVMYDRTVRTCDRKDIIQFRYGGDGLDPMKSEQNDNPIDLKNLEAFSKTVIGSDLRTQRYLSPDELIRTSDHFVSTLKQKKVLGHFKEEELLLDLLLGKVSKYFHDKAGKLRRNYESSGKACETKGLTQANKEYLKNCFHGITDRQLSYFFNAYVKKLNRALMEPGQAIGALTAQSIGEPATQMTLKTFHFAGISSMSITQGVPRVNEIINCTKNIATPIITIRLNSGSKDDAIGVKNCVESLPLGRVLHSIEEIWDKKQCRLNIILSAKQLKELKIKIHIDYIVGAIHRALKSKIKHIASADSLRINLVPLTKTNLVFELKSLRRRLVKIPIGGISTIHRALISKEEKTNRHIIYAEGLGLRQVLMTEGVDQINSFSNHILEIEQCMGIEAARNSIINQITQTMREHGVNVNPRHINLLAEVMTCKGRVIGFTRNGVDKMKDSTMMLASFEKTADFLFDAATQGKHDRMRGVSEKIITGQPISVGTGMFDIKWQTPESKLVYSHK